MKHTKIVCTIGPASEDPKIIAQLIKAGMNVARLNMSHGSHAWHGKTINNIRAVSKKLGVHVGILADLQGPKIRLGQIDAPIMLEAGKTIVLTTDIDDDGRTKIQGTIPVDYEYLHQEVKVGATILIDDGKVECRVTSIRGKSLVAEVIMGGMVSAHKGLNLPQTVTHIAAITEKDHEDIVFAVKHDVDFIALSFVRSAADIESLRKLLPAKKPAIQIIAKIEQHEAITNFDQILEVSDAIMVARGDLALESESSQVPIVQKEIIAKARHAAKPVIVATQMLDSMERNPRPTRAEISDVANAVIDHTDAVMLSGETAGGKFPVRTVETMCKIIEQTENSPYDDVSIAAALGAVSSRTHTIAALAALSAKLTEAKAVIAFSHSGNIARILAHFRQDIPMILGAGSERVANQLSLVWGINNTIVIEKTTSAKVVFDTITKHAAKMLGLKKGATIIRAAASATAAAHESMIEVKKI